MADPPFDQLLDGIRAALHGRRAVALERVQRIERALAEYTAAVEEWIAREYARQHGLAQPKLQHDRERAAQALRAAVIDLPELVAVPEGEPREPPPEPEREPARSASRGHPRAIVVVGGPGRKAKSVPAELEPQLEWIDTTRQGTVAIGNLTQRIRGGRVAALVLLEGLVGHRHSEPLVAAAREAGIPLAYAGKGGRTALERALGDVVARLG